MIKKITTAIPPEEFMELVRKACGGCEGLKVTIKYVGTFYNIPRYEVVLEGDEVLIRNVMEKLMKARAGG